MSNFHKDLPDVRLHPPLGFQPAANATAGWKNEVGSMEWLSAINLPAALDFVDNTVAPPTENAGDIYVILNNGATHANWDGAGVNSWVRFDGAVWNAVAPVAGMKSYDSSAKVFKWFDGAAWVSADLGYTAATRTITNKAGADVVLPIFTATDAGLVPGSGGGTAKFLRADGTWAAPPTGTTTYTGLTDTPNGLIGDALKLLRVNSGETAIEHVAMSAIGLSAFDNDSGFITSSVYSGNGTIPSLTTSTITDTWTLSGGQLKVVGGVGVSPFRVDTNTINNALTVDTVNSIYVSTANQSGAFKIFESSGVTKYHFGNPTLTYADHFHVNTNSRFNAPVGIGITPQRLFHVNGTFILGGSQQTGARIVYDGTRVGFGTNANSHSFQFTGSTGFRQVQNGADNDNCVFTSTAGVPADDRMYGLAFGRETLTTSHNSEGAQIYIRGTQGAINSGNGTLPSRAYVYFEGYNSNATDSHGQIRMNMDRDNGNNLYLENFGSAYSVDTALQNSSRLYAQKTLFLRTNNGDMIFQRNTTEAMRVKTGGQLNISQVPTYADDTAAGTGGLVTGDIYKDSTGNLRIKL